MAIAEDIYTRCRVCTKQAANILLDMIDGKKLNPMTVQSRRTAADVAGDTTYSLLGHAFITPIDREDLWLLREAAEQVWRTAEDTAILLFHCGRQLPSVCEPVIQATITCCAAAGKITEMFPHPDATLPQMRVLREAQHICHTTIRNCFADVTARRICEGACRAIAACEMLISILRYTAIKNA